MAVPGMRDGKHAIQIMTTRRVGTSFVLSSPLVSSQGEGLDWVNPVGAREKWYTAHFNNGG
eukprot:CAMPEP_0195011466 /NCGR_PEP_ID=MMETSP0326_2-20130528/10974_1 /TAXON_ID=2866 ORGANISM="Crypthecodinium cohnii, Strain Seligo" /NCGR_SAMPLE_ID=MMETSP0326_2 /ASSEMBLY_ACC=CAM_ASM_000348 /LENGTH=60 /DNA_ID=CAMNT_0040020601 /DNA_START=167 /DNA_END=345 /DNA_ORIENTATION=-